MLKYSMVYETRTCVHRARSLNFNNILFVIIPLSSLCISLTHCLRFNVAINRRNNANCFIHFPNSCKKFHGCKMSHKKTRKTEGKRNPLKNWRITVARVCFSFQGISTPISQGVSNSEPSKRLGTSANTPVTARSIR